MNEDSSKAGSNSKARVLSFHAEALLLIHNHPDWTVAQIAQHLGCSKAKLYRDAVINRALKGRNASGNRPPSGFKSADGDIEAQTRRVIPRPGWPESAAAAALRSGS